MKVPGSVFAREEKAPGKVRGVYGMVAHPGGGAVTHRNRNVKDAGFVYARV